MDSIFTLPQLIENVASQSPDHEAFRCLDRSVSYIELHKKTEKLASYLINSGVQKGDRIGIYMNRCLETAFAVYGILKSGAAYVPLDPFAPISRTASVIKDCHIEYLITTVVQKRKIAQLVKEVDFLKMIIGDVQELPVFTVSWDTIFTTTLEGYIPARILEQDLAFILYTSGSTGVPKGIMHTHYSALSLAKIAADTYDFNNEDVFGNPAPLHFDPSTFGYFVAPLVGATTVIIPDAHLKMPASLSALIANEKITVWYSVPLMLIQLLLSDTLQKHEFGALRWVLFAGEVFITKHLRALMQFWPHARFSNLYGPAELILCTFYNVETPPSADDSIPIGTVWDNTEYKILGKDNTEVTTGIPGELVVRSATLMKGYWNNKKLTEKSFYRVEVASGYDHIYYRTGDLVQENDNKELMFLGRKDRQIKLRGYRIELDEIEATLIKNEFVKEAAVIVIRSVNNTEELVAVVRIIENAAVSTADLRFFCKNLLPYYAIPKKIILMNDFPRTGTGKIDRNKITELIESNTKL